MTSCQLSARSQAYSSTSSTPWWTKNAGRRAAVGGARRERGRLRPCMGHLLRETLTIGLAAWATGGGEAKRAGSGLLGFEGEGGAVDAVAQTRAVARPVREDVAEVGLAAGATHLGAVHEMRAVVVLADGAAGGRLVKARPAGP